MTSMKIPLLDLKAEYQPIKKEILRAVEEVLDGMQLYLGPNVRALEEEFARYIGTKHGVGVGSGTDALLLAYQALGVQPGDEVIVPSLTFIATVAPLSFLGAKPVFVDIDPETFNLDPEQVAAAVTPRTRGIVPVHLYGQAADLDPLLETARRNKLWVVEDVCQAIGGDYRNRKLGSWGTVGCFSFVYTKNIKSYGDAGMVTTNDPALAERIRSIRDHGRSDKYTHPQFGLNLRLAEIEAAIVRIQMKYIEERTEGRRRNARFLSDALSGCGIIAPKEMDYARHVWHQYVVRSTRREALARHLAEAGIATGIHYPIPCHLQESCRPYSRGKGSLPHTEKAANEILSIPVYPELTADQLGHISRTLVSFCRQQVDSPCAPARV